MSGALLKSTYSEYISQLVSYMIKYFLVVLFHFKINPLRANPTKQSNVHKKFVGFCQRIVWVWPFCGVETYRVKLYRHCIVSSPLGSGGMIFVSSARQGGQLLNFKSQGEVTFRGGDFRQSSRGGLLYHDELLVFPQNASPWILQISPAALSYIFLTFS